MNNNDKIQYLREEYGLDDEQITAVLEDEWSGWFEDQVAEA